MIDPVSFGVGAFMVWGIWVVSVIVKGYPGYNMRMKVMTRKQINLELLRLRTEIRSLKNLIDERLN